MVAISSLTRNQRKVYEWLKAHDEPANGWTVREIARYTGLSPGVTEKHLEVLVAEGLINEKAAKS